MTSDTPTPSAIPEWKADLARRTPPGWYGLATPPGWDELVAGLHRAIVALHPDYEVYQVKEKFGQLRFYCSVEDDPAVAGFISDAEVRSAGICQECGLPGELTVVGGWYATHCAAHARRPSTGPAEESVAEPD